MIKIEFTMLTDDKPLERIFSEMEQLSEWEVIATLMGFVAH